MAWSIEIGERVTRQLAGMDEFRHDLLLLEMLSLSKDPMGRGEELRREGAVCLRTLGVGSLGLLVFEVDVLAEHVRVVDVLWR